LVNAKLEAAIAATQEPDDAPLTVKISVGPERFCVLMVPRNITALEMLALIAYIPNGLPKLLAQSKGPHLEIARSLPT
jgi:hypothetical protein